MSTTTAVTKPEPVSVEIQCLKLTQRNIPLYLGVMKARDVLATTSIDIWTEEAGGYQREQYKNKQNEIVEYLLTCPIPVIPPIVLGLRGAFEYKPRSGTLTVPRAQGALWAIDGQQRFSAFQIIKERLDKIEKLKRVREERKAEAAQLKTLLEYGIPVVIVDDKAVIAAAKTTQPNIVLTERDVESFIFYVINKTPKTVNSSLKDLLTNVITQSQVAGIPVVERESWRSHAVPIATAMNADNSPLAHSINMAGFRRSNRIMTLTSFVSSMEKLLLLNENFKKLSTDKQANYLMAYWNIVKKMFPEPFEESKRKNYLLLKTMGIYTLNYLASDIYDACLAAGHEVPTEADIEPYLGKLAKFNWERKTSPLRLYGGQKGIKNAHDLVKKLVFPKSKRVEVAA